MAKLGDTKEEQMQFRLLSKEKELIERAAAGENMRKSVYLRRCAIKQAEIDLANNPDYDISQDEMNAFISALDKPAVSKPQLRELLSKKTILE